MGTQFFQGNLNHWWEPHSSMDQSQFWQATEQFENQPQQQWQQKISLSKLDDVFQQFMQESIYTQKSIEESCKRMEMHFGYIIERLKDVEVNTEVNPREEGQAIVTKSDKIFYEEEGWPPHRARDSRLQYPKGRRRNQINPIPASSFPASMGNTSSLPKIAWQEEQAQASRAGAAEALAMEEDDEDDDFDVEEGEEEDSDDSMS
ncbi:hypothetical protein LR48_Vigan316s001200 [Vigna angularis]|uniref:Retrotransposon gag domain-containing protein n=1 Tax=Phaseolus angularis TaxID=3914 RepID=A0A0L9T836_PHAAN|nr:hypothetical protein LR48_Vigan316s001200 [Vigna angularis]